MQIALTGTPGTGKTTIAALLPYKVIDINALVKGGMNFGKDPERGCLEADMDALAKHLAKSGLVMRPLSWKAISPITSQTGP